MQNETKKTIGQMSDEEISSAYIQRYCDKMQIKAGTKEYNEIMERNLILNTKTI